VSPPLRGDQQAIIRVEHFLDEILADIGPVTVGRIDEVDAETGQAPERLDCSVVIRGRAPDAWSGDAHRTETQTINDQVAADGERAGSRSRN
jgi:hypothetical protein